MCIFANKHRNEEDRHAAGRLIQEEKEIMMEPTKKHYLCVEVEEMARYLGIDLWGCTPDGGALRTAPAGSGQPTGTMTREQITDEFVRQFVVVPVRPCSGYLEVKKREFVSPAPAVVANEKEALAA